MSEKTIAAISTALGEGGIAVIRISGDNAISVADKCFKSVSGKKLSELSGYQALKGFVYSKEELLDEAVALVFKAPKSYTGEDTVEISVHGGTLLARQVLRAILECGAIIAERGEFTKRAFLNGKLDLAKAESVMGLISAQNDAALRISREAHSGRISCEIEGIIEKLLETAASLAAFTDYPDDDFPELSKEQFSVLLNSAEQLLYKLLKTYDAGKILREGIDCAIVGKPNVGKSTLMNMLSGTERSIVTDIAGTTRDIVEETVNIGDIVLRLSDTAGIHTTGDTVEKLGVDKALQKIANAALILAVFDASNPLSSDDTRLLQDIKNKKAIVILNKSDLDVKIDASAFEGLPLVEISAKTGEGKDELEKAIVTITETNLLEPDAAILISERQRSCVGEAQTAVKEALLALEQGYTLDAVGVCIDDALNALLALTGKRVTEEVTNEVFKRFCVGK